MDPTDPRALRSRAAILDAAVRVVADSGIAAATMDGVAVEAGVSRSTLYRHFPSFGALLFAALDVVAPAPVQVTGDAEARLGSALLGLGRALREGPWGRVVGSVVERAERDPEVRRYHAAFTATRRRPMAEAIRDGVVDGLLVDDVDAEELTTRLVAPLYYRRLVLHEPMDDDEVIAHLGATLAPFLTGRVPRRG
jgi:AcrR family transcriptional regulator